MEKIYTWKTPNGYKPLILLEELEIEYELKPVPLDGSQKEKSYLKINPNGKIPALVDGNITLFESGAILIYLAEKYNKFLPKEGQERANVISWLMFQMGGVGPMFGQHAHFNVFADEKVPYAIERYKKESLRLAEVVDKQLSKNAYIASENYSIADIALFPWFKGAMKMNSDLFNKFENIKSWLEKIEQRDAVKKAYDIEFE